MSTEHKSTDHDLQLEANKNENIPSAVTVFVTHVVVVQRLVETVENDEGERKC